MPKKKSNDRSKENLKVVIPVILSVVFGAILLIQLVIYIIFVNTVYLDYSLIHFSQSKICSEENLSKIKNEYIDGDESADKEEALRGYYFFNYAICGGGEDGGYEYYSDGFRSYIESKGIKYDEEEVEE